MVGRITKRFGIAIVALLVLGTGVAIGISMTALDFHPLEPGQGQVTDSALAIDSESLTYSGLDVTDVTLDVNNTDGSSHTADIYVDLVDSSGTSVASGSKTGVSISANTVKSVTVSMSPATNVTNFQDVKVRIEETG